MSTVVKVKKETARELAKIIGKLTMERGKKATYDDAIRFLLTKEKRRPSADLKKLIKKSFAGASPEDYKEYAYEDI
jgi:predicted Zn-dependent protease